MKIPLTLLMAHAMALVSLLSLPVVARAPIQAIPRMTSAATAKIATMVITIPLVIRASFLLDKATYTHSRTGKPHSTHLVCNAPIHGGGAPNHKAQYSTLQVLDGLERQQCRHKHGIHYCSPLITDYNHCWPSSG